MGTGVLRGGRDGMQGPTGIEGITEENRPDLTDRGTASLSNKTRIVVERIRSLLHEREDSLTSRLSRPCPATD
jgi:hypothetical protein